MPNKMSSILVLWVLGQFAPSLANAEPLTADRAATIRRTIESYRGTMGTQTRKRVEASLYMPSRDPAERSASIVARAGALFLEGAKHEKDIDPEYAVGLIQSARRSADSLMTGNSIPPWDMDEDSLAGFGRIFPSAKSTGETSARVVDGGYTYYWDGSCQRDRAYQTDLFETAIVMGFIADLASILRKSEGGAAERYIAFARRLADDTWSNGEAFGEGRYFYYWRTTGECERGWDIKNINLMLAIPLLTIADLTGDRRYRDRAQTLWNTELWELGQDGSAQNYGYYGKRTVEAARRAGSGPKFKLVGGTQDLQVDGKGAMNCRQSSITCGSHLLREAYYLYETGLRLGTDARPLIRKMLDSFKDWKNEAKQGCFRESTGDSCEGFVCALAAFDPDAREGCLAKLGTGRASLGEAWAVLRNENRFGTEGVAGPRSR
jgi:hypothetical protein